MEKRKLTCGNASAFLLTEPCNYGGPIPPVSFLPVSYETGFFIYHPADFEVCLHGFMITAYTRSKKIGAKPRFLRHCRTILILPYKISYKKLFHICVYSFNKLRCILSTCIFSLYNRFNQRLIFILNSLYPCLLILVKTKSQHISSF